MARSHFIVLLLLVFQCFDVIAETEDNQKVQAEATVPLRDEIEQGLRKDSVDRQGRLLAAMIGGRDQWREEWGASTPPSTMWEKDRVREKPASAQKAERARDGQEDGKEETVQLRKPSVEKGEVNPPAVERREEVPTNTAPEPAPLGTATEGKPQSADPRANNPAAEMVGEKKWEESRREESSLLEEMVEDQERKVTAKTDRAEVEAPRSKGAEGKQVHEEGIQEEEEKLKLRADQDPSTLCKPVAVTPPTETVGPRVPLRTSSEEKQEALPLRHTDNGNDHAKESICEISAEETGGSERTGGSGKTRVMEEGDGMRLRAPERDRLPDIEAEMETTIGSGEKHARKEEGGEGEARRKAEEDAQDQLKRLRDPPQRRNVLLEIACFQASSVAGYAVYHELFQRAHAALAPVVPSRGLLGPAAIGVSWAVSVPVQHQLNTLMGRLLWGRSRFSFKAAAVISIFGLVSAPAIARLWVAAGLEGSYCFLATAGTWAFYYNALYLLGPRKDPQLAAAA